MGYETRLGADTTQKYIIHMLQEERILRTAKNERKKWDVNKIHLKSIIVEKWGDILYNTNSVFIGEVDT